MTNTSETNISSNGFTLIEVIIAIAIFSLGILATMGMQISVVGGNTGGNVVTEEVMLAQWILEQKKNEPNPVDIDDAVPAGVDTGPYDVDISVTNPIGGDASRFITVTVSRNGGIGGHPVTVQCLTMGNGI